MSIWFTEAQDLDLLGYTLYSKFLRHPKNSMNESNLKKYTRGHCFSQQAASKMRELGLLPCHSTFKMHKYKLSLLKASPFMISCTFPMLHFSTSHKAEDRM